MTELTSCLDVAGAAAALGQADRDVDRDGVGAAAQHSCDVAGPLPPDRLVIDMRREPAAAAAVDTNHSHVRDTP